MNLVFTKIAKSAMDDIWDYIAEDSVNAADKVIEEIHDKCKNIAQTPDIGRNRPELANGVKSLPVRKYLIFYHTEYNATFIDRVLSGYRNLPDFF